MKVPSLFAIGLALGIAAPAASQEALTAPGPAGDLAATLVRPAEGKPVVLVIPGSGPTDRDGNNRLGVTAAPYRLLAEALAAHGIGTVRTDKRGLFGSRQAVADPNAVTIADYVADTAAWVDAARTATGRDCVWLLGHSEGGLIALAAAQELDHLCGVILVAAPGRPIGAILREQLAANPANGPLLEQAYTAIAMLEAGQHVEVAGLHPGLMGLFAPAVQGFLIDMMAHDPAALAAQVTQPLLIVQGGADLQVSIADGKALHAAQPRARYLVLAQMNHVLKTVGPDDPAAKSRELRRSVAADLPRARRCHCAFRYRRAMRSLSTMLTIRTYIGAMVSPFVPPSARTPRWFLAVVAVATVASIPLAALLAQGQTGASFSVAETGRGYATLQAAVDAIGDAEGTVLIAPGNWNQCAVQTRGRVHFRAVQPGSALLGGRACEGKAALVLRGDGATVEGLTFADISVDDGNGAGIRLEHGPLHVSQSWFRDSQQGILAGNDRDSELVVDKSTFSRLGTCENAGGCAHSIYVGDYGSVAVTRTRFEQGTGGHYLKSRAARITVEDNSFDDANGHGTNYMIDLPNGATGTIRGNWFVQGQDKENWSALIAVGAEEASYSSDGLVIADNDARLAPGLRRSPVFVADWTGDRLAIARNRLGTGIREFERR